MAIFHITITRCFRHLAITVFFCLIFITYQFCSKIINHQNMNPYYSCTAAAVFMKNTVLPQQPGYNNGIQFEHFLFSPYRSSGRPTRIFIECKYCTQVYFMFCTFFSDNCKFIRRQPYVSVGSRDFDRVLINTEPVYTFFKRTYTRVIKIRNACYYSCIYISL